MYKKILTLVLSVGFVSLLAALTLFSGPSPRVANKEDSRSTDNTSRLRPLSLSRPLPTPAPTPSPTPEPTASPSATPEPYDYSRPVPCSDTAPEDWFDDAVFLGDSRTEGLILFSGIKNTTGIAYKGLNVEDPGSKKVLFSGQSEPCTALDLMRRGKYAKIYVMLGVNELGWYNGEQRFYDAYTALIGQLREIEPDADIYIQTIIPVTAAHSKAHSYVKNETIVLFNDVIRRVAEEQEVYLIDTDAALADATGVLPAELAADGVHLTRAGYAQWLEYLKTHIVKG